MRTPRRPVRRFATAGIFTVAFLLLSACGGGDDASDPPAEDTASEDTASDSSDSDSSDSDSSDSDNTTSDLGPAPAMTPASAADCQDGPETVEAAPAADPGDAYPLLLTDAEIRGCFLTSTLACDQIGLVIGRAVVTDTFPADEEGQDGYRAGEKAPDTNRLVVLDVSMTNLADGPDASGGTCQMLNEVPNALYWETIDGIAVDTNEIVGAVAVNRISIELGDNQTWEGKVVLAIDAAVPAVTFQTGFGENESFTHTYQIPSLP